jgi:hypothetical protein
LISSIRARSVSIDGGSGADFLATRDDIEQEWLPDKPPLFNGQRQGELSIRANPQGFR